MESRSRRVGSLRAVPPQEGAPTRRHRAIWLRSRWLQGCAPGLEVIGVELGVFLPLLGDVIRYEDSRHRARGLASAAVDALFRVDVKLGVLVSAVDAVHRANIDAGLVLGTD